MGRMLGGDFGRSTHQSEGSTQARESNCIGSHLTSRTYSIAKLGAALHVSYFAAPSPPTSHTTAPHWWGWCMLPPCRETQVGGRQSRRPRQYPPRVLLLPAALWVGWGKGKGGIIPFQLVTPLPVSSVFTPLVLLLTQLVISTHGDVGFQVVYSRQQQICRAPSTLRHASKAPGLVNHYIVCR